MHTFCHHTCAGRAPCAAAAARPKEIARAGLNILLCAPCPSPHSPQRGKNKSACRSWNRMGIRAFRCPWVPSFRFSQRPPRPQRRGGGRGGCCCQKNEQRSCSGGGAVAPGAHTDPCPLFPSLEYCTLSKGRNSEFLKLKNNTEIWRERSGRDNNEKGRYKRT